MRHTTNPHIDSRINDPQESNTMHMARSRRLHALVTVLAATSPAAALAASLAVPGLEWSAGIGFRFKVMDAVVTRIDFAGSREGFRFMWTFSDIFKARSEIYR